MKKIVSLMVLIILVSGCVEQPNPYQKVFGGVKLDFRADLDEAAKVPVYPNETALISTLLNQNVQAIGVAYIPNETENSYYLADSFELAYKLTVINKYYFGRIKLVDSIPVNSSTEAFYKASSQEPIIMLVGPTQTNSTLVGVAGSLILVQGSSFEEVNNTYNSLDLATDKLLLVLMGPST